MRVSHAREVSIDPHIARMEANCLISESTTAVARLYAVNSTLQHQHLSVKIKYNLLNIFLPHHLIVPRTRTRNSNPNKCVQIGPYQHASTCILFPSKSHKNLEFTTE